ncbi:MAG TPA: ribosomal protein S18-alanine N-acetyltransferase [Anaerolineae bacterium]|nr:ribosomal protein S18-alanine N-acetyltransferase [Anaerolineae bacterium]
MTEIPFSFEKMQLKDVPAVMAIEQRSFTLPWSANTYRHEILENQSAHYYVLRHRNGAPGRRADWLSRLARREAGAPIVGYGGFWCIVDEAHISTIAVDVGWRGRGLGEFLLASMIEQAIVLNSVKVTLEVRESNRVAQNLYRKYGFVVASTRPRYYQDNGENAFLMALEGVSGEAYRRALRDLTGLLQARLASADGEPIRARADR